MSRNARLATLVVLSVAQLAAAASSIARHEATLRWGAQYRLRTEPIDPADAFRGRYVAVRPTITIPAPIAPETLEALERIQRGETSYVVLATDNDGFARVAQILPAPPAQGDYLPASRAWPQMGPEAQPGTRRMLAAYIVEFPFDRYYMNEAAAPAAEQRYGEAMRRNAASRAWLVVRVRNGAGIIEGLFIDGVSIEESIKR